MKQGLTHLYTGDGKGKTTAALGLTLRALGYGMRVVVVQFLKGSDTGELRTLESVDGVTVLRNTQDFGFYPYASEEEKAEMARQHNANLAEATRLVSAGLCDLLVLDEICAAYNIGALDRALADELVLRKPAELELVLTGRDAPQQFAEAADYITELVKQKHPYDAGIAARQGIEF